MTELKGIQKTDDAVTLDENYGVPVTEQELETMKDYMKDNAPEIDAAQLDDFFGVTLTEEQVEVMKEILKGGAPGVVVQGDAVHLDNFFNGELTEEDIEAMREYFQETKPNIAPDGDAVQLDDFFNGDVTKEQLEIMRDMINEGTSPGAVLEDNNFPSAVCESISAKIVIAAANGDITTIEIEAIICEEFGVNSLEELQEQFGDDLPDFNPNNLYENDGQKPFGDNGNNILKDDAPLETPAIEPPLSRSLFPM